MKGEKNNWLFSILIFLMVGKAIRNTTGCGFHFFGFAICLLNCREYSSDAYNRIKQAIKISGEQ